MNENYSFELLLARAVTNVLMVAGLFATVVGVVTLLRWAF